MKKYFKEVWENIQGYEGLYQISNYGRVKSLNRKFRRGDYIKKPFYNEKMDCIVISLCKNGETKLYPLIIKLGINSPHNNYGMKIV